MNRHLAPLDVMAGDDPKGITEQQVRNRLSADPLALGRPIILGKDDVWLICFKARETLVLVHARTRLPKQFGEAGSAGKRLFTTLGCVCPVTVDLQTVLPIDLVPLPLLYLK